MCTRARRLDNNELHICMHKNYFERVRAAIQLIFIGTRGTRDGIQRLDRSGITTECSGSACNRDPLIRDFHKNALKKATEIYELRLTYIGSSSIARLNIRRTIRIRHSSGLPVRMMGGNVTD